MAEWMWPYTDIETLLYVDATMVALQLDRTIITKNEDGSQNGAAGSYIWINLQDFGLTTVYM